MCLLTSSHTQCLNYIQRTTHRFLDTSCSFKTIRSTCTHLPHSVTLPWRHNSCDLLCQNSSIPCTEFTNVMPYHFVHLFSFTSIKHYVIMLTVSSSTQEQPWFWRFGVPNTWTSFLLRAMTGKELTRKPTKDSFNT